MSEPDADLADLFRDEATERLDEMDAALLAVESGDAGPEVIDALFRNAHTIKGGAGMLGLDDISTLAHAVEDVFSIVRDSGVFPPELAAPLLRATGELRARVTGTDGPIDALLEDLAATRAALAGDGARKPPAHRAAAHRTPRTRTEPPRTEPPRTEPPRTEPPRTEPPRTEPPRTEPPRTEPPRTEPVPLSRVAPGARRESRPGLPSSARCGFRPRKSTICSTSSGR